MDTDSCVFISNVDDETEFNPELSSYLGGSTNKLPPEQHITEFLTCGPQNYAYKTSDGSCTVKVKGFCLDHNTSQLINMESMKSLEQNMKDEQTITVVNENKITRERGTRKIVNRREEKKYQMVYDKRIILDDDVNTVPYGYYWHPRERSTISP